LCGNLDSCPIDFDNDIDGDFLCNFAECFDDVQFDVGFGNCDSYSDSNRNFDFCFEDGVCEICSCACSSHPDCSMDLCPLDVDNDGDSDDLCANVDSCAHDSENDVDEDGLCANVDNCPIDANNDMDSDGLCESDDSCPQDSFNDADSDNLCKIDDICENDPLDDIDKDGLCADVDICPFSTDNDADGDGRCAVLRCTEELTFETEHGLCGSYKNGESNEGYCEIDRVCEVCGCSCAIECGNVDDECPFDASNDEDRDFICGDVDSCPVDIENDADSDQLCGDIDICPHDAGDDIDSDGICGDIDSCPLESDNDRDSDNICGDIDSCPNDADNDADNDNLCANEDSCPLDDENDADNDNLCANLDLCEYDPLNDFDEDGLCANVDSCPLDVENDVDGDDICGDMDLENDNEIVIQSEFSAAQAEEEEEDAQFIGLLVGIICAVVVLIIIIIIVLIVARRLGAHKPNHYYEYRCVHDVSYYGRPSFKHPLLSIPQAMEHETFLPSKVEKHEDVEWLEIVEDHWLPTRSELIPGESKEMSRVQYFEKVIKRPTSLDKHKRSPRKHQIMPLTLDDSDDGINDELDPVDTVKTPDMRRARRDAHGMTKVKVSKSLANSKEVMEAALVDPTLKAMYQGNVNRASLNVVTENSKQQSKHNIVLDGSSKHKRKVMHRPRRMHKVNTPIDASETDAKEAPNRENASTDTKKSDVDTKKIDSEDQNTAETAVITENKRTRRDKRRDRRAVAQKGTKSTDIDSDNVGVETIAKVGTRSKRVSARRRLDSKSSDIKKSEDKKIVETNTAKKIQSRRSRRRRIAKKAKSEPLAREEAVAVEADIDAKTPNLLVPKKRMTRRHTDATSIKRENAEEPIAPNEQLTMSKAKSIEMFKKYEKLNINDESAMDL
jgi:hypothetical protein